jgi:Phytanoyl-CoA dioxygenase (PhyH)
MDSDVHDLYREIQKCDLVENIAELDAFGYTVVPPEKLAPPSFTDRIREAVIDLHARNTGHRIVDVESDTTGEPGPLSAVFGLLFEDQVFQEAILNPAVYALARYMCGKSVVLGEFAAFLKNQHPAPTHPLHIDQVGTPPPLPSYAQTVNMTWTLTEFTMENGTTSIVPGSHRFGRPPLAYETDFLAENPPVKAMPIVAPTGSLIVYGPTWHGAYPRSNPGVRLNVFMLFSRSYMRPLHDYRAECPPEILEANPPEFAELIGMGAAYPMVDPSTTPGAVPDLQKFVRSGMSPWS